MSAVPDSRNICACLFVSVLCPSEQKFLLGLHPSCACLSVSVSCPNRLSSFTGTCCSESVNLHSSLVLCANKPVFGQAPVFSPASNHHIVDSPRRHCLTSPLRRVVNSPSRRHVVNMSRCRSNLYRGSRPLVRLPWRLPWRGSRPLVRRVALDLWDCIGHRGCVRSSRGGNRVHSSSVLLGRRQAAILS